MQKELHIFVHDMVKSFCAIVSCLLLYCDSVVLDCSLRFISQV